MVFQRQHFLVLTSTFALLLLLCSTAEAKCRIKPSTTVAYYGGHGATSDCQSWEDHFFSWWATAEPRVVHAKVLPSELKECDDLAQTNVTLWVQPGGNAYDQQASLGAEGKANLLRFIRAGQGQQQGERATYLGTCAGFFLTASSYWWEGQQFSWPNMLGITPELEGSITTIWDDATPPGYVVTNVTHLDGIGRSRRQCRFFQAFNACVVLGRPNTWLEENAGVAAAAGDESARICFDSG